ncbi:hypothetical protein GUITHDRAFT_104055 [Guillardia theta CCMP2712]|uniref:Uncharacterized protein n=1 Tax=Guillardia theta (strain CCMP2712) TaxID=905079 RepID=L1JNT4_GUITC|nr:hypothetical protein GUITHDRAFT_104055 [Guillardia theta CCMP2712]EKX50241.1 hypothetical protein GUITHDRAFT_104055 [Guillardia theta CCMP2712]|eukprot:XP_005837221.1 hypothetical protein GUITHDRAFT_104055 [Guillardia theta CCMP2712]
MTSSTAPAESAGGNLPDALKEAVKAALGPRYPEFVKTVRSMKNKQIDVAAANLMVSTLLAGRNDLVEQFKSWSQSAGPSQPAAQPQPASASSSAQKPTGATGLGTNMFEAGGASKPGSMSLSQGISPIKGGSSQTAENQSESKPSPTSKIATDGKLGAQTKTAEAVNPVGSASKTPVVKEKSPNILSDPVLHKAGHVSSRHGSLDHVQMFPFGSRAFSYMFKDPAEVKQKDSHWLQIKDSYASPSRLNVGTSRSLTPRLLNQFKSSPSQRFDRPSPVVQLNQSSLRLVIDRDISSLIDDQIVGRSEDAREVLDGCRSTESTPRSSQDLGSVRRSDSDDWEEDNVFREPNTPDYSSSSSQRKEEALQALQGLTGLGREAKSDWQKRREQKIAAQLKRHHAAGEEAVKGMEQEVQRIRGVLKDTSQSESKSTLEELVQALNKTSGSMEEKLKPLSSAWTYLLYGHAEGSKGEVEERLADVTRLQSKSKSLKSDILELESSINEKQKELIRISEARKALAPSWIGLIATHDIADLVRARAQLGDVCKGISELSAEVWEESGPQHLKSSLSLQDRAEKLRQFAKERDSQMDSGGSTKLRALLIALVLTRSDSKEAAVSLTLEIISILPNVLPILVKLCISRCAALLPFFAPSRQPYKNKNEPNSLRCPLGLPISGRRDCNRFPLPIPEYSARLKEDVDAAATNIFLVKDKPLKVGNIASICLLDEEWIRILSDSPGADGAVQVERKLFGSKEATHKRGAKLIPHVMYPEGGTGVTEMFARLLVALSGMDAKWTHGTFQQFDPNGPKRSAEERMYTWLASAARLCSGPVAHDEDRERIKYMLQHMSTFLQVTSVPLVSSYPKQARKIAIALKGSAAVLEICKTLPEASTLIPMLDALASEEEEEKKIATLKSYVIQSSKQEEEEGEQYIDTLLSRTWDSLSKEQHDMFKKISDGAGFNNIGSDKSQIDNKAKFFSAVLRGDPSALGSSPIYYDTVQSLTQLMAGKSEEEKKTMKELIQAKLAEKFVERIQQLPKMFTFGGGFQGFAWSACLGRVAGASEEGLSFLKFLGQLLGDEHVGVPHMRCRAEPSERLNKGNGETRACVNMFAALMQNEELSLAAAKQLAEDTIAHADRSAFFTYLWVREFCGKQSIVAALQQGANASAALEALEAAAETLNTVLKTLLDCPLVRAASSDITDMRINELRGLQNLLEALNWDPRTMQPRWTAQIEGGRLYMQHIGIAEGPRTYGDVLNER